MDTRAFRCRRERTSRLGVQIGSCHDYLRSRTDIPSSRIEQHQKNFQGPRALPPSCQTHLQRLQLQGRSQKDHEQKGRCPISTASQQTLQTTEGICQSIGPNGRPNVSLVHIRASDLRTLAGLPSHGQRST